MDRYQKKDGLKYLLEQRIKQAGDSDFPLGINNVIDDFKVFESKLYCEVHPRVNEGSATLGDGRLTDHGVAHINRVFDCANKLVRGMESKLRGFELLLLCIAIHLHDIGNIDGRTNHEKRIREVLKRLEIKIPINDSITHETVINIAQSHGGLSSLTNDKDTFFDLQTVVSLFGDFNVRPVLLASILRFADELSDFYNRTDNIIGTPLKNELYHSYSNALRECQIEGRSILLTYWLKYEDTQKKLQKGSKKEYLYDEIQMRLSKLMREMEYCCKYSEGFIRLSSVSVTLIVAKKENLSSVEYKEKFNLCLRGYPDSNQNGFYYYVNYDKDTKSPIEPRYKTGKDLKAAIKGGA